MIDELGSRERREQWIELLKGCSFYHHKKALKTKPVLIGIEPSDEHLSHKIWCIAVNDAIGLIELLPTIDEVINKDDPDLPQHLEGPAG